MNPHPNRSIEVQTYEGNSLENVIDADPAQNYVMAARQGYDPLWRLTQLTRPTGRYNCHGLVFAGRRTQILQDQQVEKCLEEDCYKRVKDPQLGDVVIYRDQRAGILHSGFVAEVQTLTPTSAEPIVIVWGKWGVDSEYRHHLVECPFFTDDGSVEFWRLTHA